MASKQVGSISIRVKPDTDQFRRDLQNDLERVENSVRGTVEVDAELDATGLRERLRAQLAGINESVKVRIDVDRSVLDRVQNTFGSGSGGVGGGRAFGGLGPFADSLALVAAVAAVAAPALALVSGALISLPAIASAVVVPIAAIALGLDGIKNAAKSLGAPLGVLKKSMSDTFQTRLTPVFAKLVGPIQSLGDFLPKVANGLSDMAESFVNTISSGPGLARIQNTISLIGESLSRSAPGIASFTSGILGLAEGVARKFPAVADWFNEVGASFTAWVDKVSASGQLDTAMSNFGATIKEILGLVGDLAKQGFDFLSDPKFGESMKQFVADVRTLVNELLPQLKTFFQDIATLVHDLVTGMEWLNKTFSKEGQDKAIEDRKKQFEIDKDKGAGEANLPGWADPEGWGISLRQKMTEIWAGVRTQVSEAIAGIVGLLAQVPAQLASAWSSLSSIAAGAWNSVVSTVTSVMAQVVSAVVSGGGRVVSEVASWPGKIAAALAGLYQAGLAAGTQLVQGFINGIGSLIGSAVAKARELASAAKNAVTGFLGIRSPSRVMAEVGQFTGQGFADGLAEKKKDIVSTAKDITTGVQDEFSKLKDLGQQGMDAGFSFGEANVKTFMSDFGIGGGALSALGDQALQFGKQALGQALTQNFFTSNVDDTIAVKNNQLNKQALGVVGKSG